jgi:hypothetical protein
MTLLLTSERLTLMKDWGALGKKEKKEGWWYKVSVINLEKVRAVPGRHTPLSPSSHTTRLLSRCITTTTIPSTNNTTTRAHIVAQYTMPSHYFSQLLIFSSLSSSH